MSAVNHLPRWEKLHSGDTCSASGLVRVLDERHPKPHLTNLGEKWDLLLGFCVVHSIWEGRRAKAQGNRMRSKVQCHIPEQGPWCCCNQMVQSQRLTGSSEGSGSLGTGCPSENYSSRSRHCCHLECRAGPALSTLLTRRLFGWVRRGFLNPHLRLAMSL